MGEHLFERLARERNITVEEMREIISVRIRRGMRICCGGIQICEQAALEGVHFG